MGIDVPTLVALVASLVALLVAMIQMTQQLFVTASNYQRCSPESIGGWARRTHRRFRWKELRFRVVFSTPRISILFPSESYAVVRQRLAQGGKLGKSTKYRVQILGKPTEHFEVSSQSKKPWFLQTETVVPYAKCTWLALLEDTLTLRDLNISITEIQHSYDYLPDTVTPNTVTRPIASADRKSLLILMSLFGIHWKEKGRSGQLSGAGEFCEVRAVNYPSVGDVFFYQDVHRQRTAFNADASDYDPCNDHVCELRSEQAARAMFHRFDLGNLASFRTQNESELRESLRDFRLRDDTVDTLVAHHKFSGEWCPGLAEAITSWAYESMPKVIYSNKNKFRSRFSAVSARSPTTGCPMFVAMLLGGSGHPYAYRADEISSVKNLTNWAREYLESLEAEVKNRIKECLGLGVTLDTSTNILKDLEVPWDRSLECLKGVQELDSYLDIHLQEKRFEEDERRIIKRTIISKQIENGCLVPNEASREAKKRGTSWVNEFDRVGADCQKKTVDDLKAIKFSSDNSVDEKFAEKIVINRLMRGSLWVMHYGNAWDEQLRGLECSLSSSWLQEGNPTVYIS